MCEMYAPKTFFASNLEYVAELAKLCVILSNVRVLWCSQIMTLFKY